MVLVNDFGGLNPTSLLVIIWVLTAIAIIFVLIRTFIHFYIHQRLSIDVLCVYLALSILIACAGIYTKITPTLFELDRVASFQETPGPGFMERANLFLRCQFALIVLFWTSIWAVKFSILMFYKDLFNKLPRQKRYWWIVFGFVAVTYLICWGTQLASCWPIPGYFHLGTNSRPPDQETRLTKSGQCNDKRDTKASNNSLYVTAALDIVGDIMMMVLLLRQLYGLQTTQINRKQKVAVAAIFSLGGIIVIVAIVRVVEIKATTEHVDPVWLALWSMIEASVAVVVSSLPSFRILLSARTRSTSAYKRRNPALPSSTSSRSRRSNPSSPFSPKPDPFSTLTHPHLSSLTHPHSNRSRHPSITNPRALSISRPRNLSISNTDTLPPAPIKTSITLSLPRIPRKASAKGMPNPPLRRTSNIRLETINAGAYLATARIPDAHTDRDSYELVVRGVNRQEQEGGEASNGGAGGVGGKASGDGGAMGGKAGGGALGGRADEIGLRGMRPAIVTTNSTRSESQEEILPPEGRVLVRRDLYMTEEPA